MSTTDNSVKALSLKINHHGQDPFPSGLTAQTQHVSSLPFQWCPLRADTATAGEGTQEFLQSCTHVLTSTQGHINMHTAIKAQLLYK